MFQSRHIVITGGATGLGYAIADALASQGARLTLVSRKAEKLEFAAQELRRCYPDVDVEIRTLDVSDPTAACEVIGEIAQRRGAIDTLFNNAGVMLEGRFEDLAAGDFAAVITTNFLGAVNVARAVLPHLRASQGRLVNIASVAGLTGTFGFTAYGSAKHALVGFTDCLYYEMLAEGVKVHLVCPAEFETPMVAELDSYRTPENLRHTNAIPRTPLDTVVADTLKGLRKERYLIIPGAKARLVVRALQLFPTTMRRIGALLVTKRG
ncbi:SDR family NAD(P)-dependent oxidoreductase [Leptospira johnsonii]|uniref:Short-chain dehydrogenase/reductase SDR n=1 Tax=Leptospira johnsonii TaxID=1917820 RepID=A0A2P2D6R2_9LEPT|nr:SDR family oxidoreductase [Leptospira johnsonii]GBF40336.1 short-chain dehydrogenase/reductase SDR [Leptospira johnsonii]